MLERFAFQTCDERLVGPPPSRTFRPGDIAVLYAWGLGQVDGAKEGTAAAGPLVTTIPYSLAVEYRRASSPIWEGSPAAFWESDNLTRIEPLYAGLVPGQVGLYQINFRIPDPPPDAPPCTLGYNLVVTVVPGLTSTSTVDSATFCVDLPR